MKRKYYPCKNCLIVSICREHCERIPKHEDFIRGLSTYNFRDTENCCRFCGYNAFLCIEKVYTGNYIKCKYCKNDFFADIIKSTTGLNIEY